MGSCDICERLKAGEGIKLRGTHFPITKFYGLINLDNPETPGHILVVPERHKEGVGDFDISERNDFMDLLSPACRYIDNPNFKELYLQISKCAKTSEEREAALRMINHPLIDKIPDDYQIRFFRGVIVPDGRHWCADIIPVDYFR